ncbi:MAG: hypothetical protein FWG25_06685, partial [Promicromonosporaceae bacterium]|nr:hypothetical protein [Promicromonosporaceae bacterium]
MIEPGPSELGVYVAPILVGTEPSAWLSPDQAVSSRVAQFQEKLLGARTVALARAPMRNRLIDAWGTFFLGVLAVVTRFWGLGRITSLIFDETYYVKDAFTLWQLGFEARWPDDPNIAFAAGDVCTFLPEAAFVVHPQVGKWLIALGLMVGDVVNPWAWRLASAVIGVAAVILVTR